MTLDGRYPIERFALMERLRRTFDLEPLPVEALRRLGLEPTVLPIVRADLILRDPINQASASTDLSGSAGFYAAMLTVPAGERWHTIWARKMGTAASTVMQVKVAGVAITVTAASTSEILLSLPGFIMDTGDSIGCETTGNGGDSGRSISLAYSRERLSS